MQTITDDAASRVVVHELSKSFGALDVLQEVSLTIRSAEVIAVIGPSGSGKSTLLRCINHLEKPEGGYVTVDGTPMGYHYRNGRLHEVNNRQLSRQRALVGMVFQHFNLFRHLTALENVMVGPVRIQKRQRRAVREDALRLLARFGLEDKAGAYPHQLSGGQQQRTAIARALAMNPALILLDEPTSALDPELCGEVIEAIRALAAEGRTMVISTHDMSLVRSIADRVFVMADGRIVESGTPDEVLDHPQHPRTAEFLRRVSQAGISGVTAADRSDPDILDGHRGTAE